jgi:hypothetical protein
VVVVPGSVTLSSADTGVTWNSSAEHTNNVAARMKIVFLKFMLPPLLIVIFKLP